MIEKKVIQNLYTIKKFEVTQCFKKILQKSLINFFLTFAHFLKCATI